jgi:hypothetical protein
MALTKTPQPHLSVKEFMGQKFDYIIPLGSSCQTRWHLQKFMKKKYGEDRSISYFFDWLWHKGSGQQIAAWLRDELTLDNVEWQIHLTGEKCEVMAGKYQFLFTHDFSFTSNDQYQCELEMMEQMETFCSKYSYLRERTLAALRSQKRIAFLSSSHLSQEHFNEIDQVLRQVYGLLDYVLFHCPFYDSNYYPIYHENIIAIPVLYQPWPGHDLSWDNVYRAIDFDVE